MTTAEGATVLAARNFRGDRGSEPAHSWFRADQIRRADEAPLHLNDVGT
jgi:hypothetical protein